MATTDSWALVTGACSGIGLELARGLAARGHPVVLVSNRGPELQRAAAILATDHHVTVQTITMDLARPEAAPDLHAEVVRRRLPVDILVSNAGILLFGEVVDADPARIENLLHLHVVTPSLLARYFGHDMRARHGGHILLVSSASSWTDFPGIAFYGSSKRYLRSLGAALREELRPWNVNVTCLAPGAVATGLYERGTGPARTAARLGLLKDPARVAELALKGMFRRRGLVLPGLDAKLMAVGSALLPRWLIRAIRLRTQYLSRP